MFIIRRPHEARSLCTFRDEMDRLFDSFFTPAQGAAATGPADAWAPALDISENEEALTIRADLPGIDAENVEISLNGDVLTIAGEKTEETESGEGGHHVRERRFGAFSRSVRIATPVDTENVDAHAKNGVLTITLRKLNPEKPRRIAVRRADA